ncbi:hypothetical protein WISP_81263 [Willisornis vidua]|uniref:Uncharacterized protein n=1 Tax=Willisornis vidua TaxID=1566151 RepID=A0ABQ9D4G4_9PASS|nr:hypothetical protein WISP_81263 [Willisornis vidua]
MEVHRGSEIHQQPAGDPVLEQVDIPKGGCDLGGSPLCGPLDPHGREAHAGAGFLAGLVILQGTHTLEKSVPKGLQSVEWTRAGAARKGLQPVGRTHVGEIGGELFPIVATPHGRR